MPTDPLAVAAYLAERTEQGAAGSTVRAIRAAIGATHRDNGAADPTAHDGVRRVLQSLTRQTAGARARPGSRHHRRRLRRHPRNGQPATAHRARHGIRHGRAERGAVDKVIVAVLFQGGLRRSGSGGAPLGRTCKDAADGAGIIVRVRRSRTDQNGTATAADVRYLKNGCAAAIRQLRDRITVQRSGLRPDATAPVLGGLGGQSIARSLTAAATAAGIDGRITGRVGLASELTARGASTTETMLAGGWKTACMVAHYADGATAEQGRVFVSQPRISSRFAPVRSAYARNGVASPIIGFAIYDPNKLMSVSGCSL